MKPFAIEPDDRAFALARDGVVLESSPSAVSDGSTGALPGADGWHTVRRLPTTTSTQHAASVLRDAQPSARALSLLAAELARRLAAHPPQPGERVWIAAPARAGRYGLGALLGVARPAGREVARLRHELRPAGSALWLLVPRRVSALPGLRELLCRCSGCELVSLPAGVAAAATSLLDLPLRGAAAPVRLLRRVPSE